MSVDPRDVEEGDPVWIRVGSEHYHSGRASWQGGSLVILADGDVRIAFAPDVEIIGWTPQLDFGDTA